MDVLKELNRYYGTSEGSLDQFEINFKDNNYHHDYVESLFDFLRYLENIEIRKDDN